MRMAFHDQDFTAHLLNGIAHTPGTSGTPDDYLADLILTLQRLQRGYEDFKIRQVSWPKSASRVPVGAGYCQSIAIYKDGIRAEIERLLK